MAASGCIRRSPERSARSGDRMPARGLAEQVAILLGRPHRVERARQPNRVWPGDRTLAPQYYFVSDLHMGGDGQLQHCDYTAEFIAFLKGLETRGPDTELLIVGDTFGFWELTLVHGSAKLEHIIQAHQAIFDQLKATGARIRVTMMVGNHDYDLACDPAFAGKIKTYKIQLDNSMAMTRTVDCREIWI